jgi:hypothetical protein
LKIRERIVDTDTEIDEMVYNLYGLTPDEIETVKRQTTNVTTKPQSYDGGSDGGR